MTIEKMTNHTKTPLRILLLEDTAEDVKLILRKLKQEKYTFEYIHVVTETDFKKQIAEFKPDIILADYHLPKFSGLDALKLVRNMENHTPFIFVTGTLGEIKAVETITLGADDFVLKDNLLRLPSSIARVLREHEQLKIREEMQQQLVEQHNLLETLIESIPEMLDYRDKDGRYLMVNQSFEKLVQKDRISITGLKEPGTLDEDLYTQDRMLHEEALESGKRVEAQSHLGVVDGINTYIETIKTPVLTGDGKIKGVVTLRRDISRSKEKEASLMQKEMLLNEAQKIAKIGSFELRITENEFNCTPEFKNILGLKKDDEIDLNAYLSMIHPADKTFVSYHLEEAIAKVSVYELNHRLIIKNGREKVVKSAGKVVARRLKNNRYNLYLIGTIQDITSKRIADKAMHQGQELERKRLSREIHDGVSQMLIAMKYNLMMMEEEVEEQNYSNTMSYINKLDSTIDNIVEETRRIINNLSIKSIEEFGITKAVTGLCNEIEGLNRFVIKKNIKIQEDRLENALAVAVYRVIQEALSNVTKYAEASEVEVNLIQSSHSLELEVSDNGKGMTNVGRTVLSASGGNGMSNMKERVGIFNGSVQINSEPNQGTSIKVKIPTSSIN